MNCGGSYTAIPKGKNYRCVECGGEYHVLDDTAICLQCGGTYGLWASGSACCGPASSASSYTYYSDKYDCLQCDGKYVLVAKGGACAAAATPAPSPPLTTLTPVTAPPPTTPATAPPLTTRSPGATGAAPVQSITWEGPPPSGTLPPAMTGAGPAAEAVEPIAATTLEPGQTAELPIPSVACGGTAPRAGTRQGVIVPVILVFAITAIAKQTHAVAYMSWLFDKVNKNIVDTWKQEFGETPQNGGSGGGADAPTTSSATVEYSPSSEEQAACSTTGQHGHPVRAAPGYRTLARHNGSAIVMETYFGDSVLFRATASPAGTGASSLVVVRLRPLAGTAAPSCSGNGMPLPIPGVSDWTQSEPCGGGGGGCCTVLTPTGVGAVVGISIGAAVVIALLILACCACCRCCCGYRLFHRKSRRGVAGKVPMESLPS